MTYFYAGKQSDDLVNTKKVEMFSAESGKRFLYTAAIATGVSYLLGEQGTYTVSGMELPNSLLLGSGISLGAEVGHWVAPSIETALLGNQSEFARDFESNIITFGSATVFGSLVSSMISDVPFTPALLGLSVGSTVAGDWAVKNWDVLGMLW